MIAKKNICYIICASIQASQKSVVVVMQRNTFVGNVPLAILEMYCMVVLRHSHTEIEQLAYFDSV